MIGSVTFYASFNRLFISHGLVSAFEARYWLKHVWVTLQNTYIHVQCICIGYATYTRSMNADSYTPSLGSVSILRQVNYNLIMCKQFFTSCFVQTIIYRTGVHDLLYSAVHPIEVLRK